MKIEIDIKELERYVPVLTYAGAITNPDGHLSSYIHFPLQRIILKDKEEAPNDECILEERSIILKSIRLKLLEFLHNDFYRNAIKLNKKDYDELPLDSNIEFLSLKYENEVIYKREKPVNKDIWYGDNIIPGHARYCFSKNSPFIFKLHDIVSTKWYIRPDYEDKDDGIVCYQSNIRVRFLYEKLVTSYTL